MKQCFLVLHECFLHVHRDASLKRPSTGFCDLTALRNQTSGIVCSRERRGEALCRGGRYDFIIQASSVHLAQHRAPACSCVTSFHLLATHTHTHTHTQYTHTHTHTNKHCIAKSIGTPASNEMFDYFSNFQEYKS